MKIQNKKMPEHKYTGQIILPQCNKSYRLILVVKILRTLKVSTKYFL